MILSILSINILASCSDAPHAQGFGPVPHEKDVEELIERLE